MPVPDGIGISQDYGITPFYWESGWYSTPGHLALDFPAPHGTPVLAPTAGTITHVGFGNGHDSWGYWIELRDGRRTHSLAHLTANSAAVKVGDVVVEGAVLGKVGSTGASTGPHLHWQVTDVQDGPVVMNKAVDPWTLFDPKRYTKEALQDYATIAALREGLDPFYFLRQIDQESRWDMYAASGAGAIGIAQIVPWAHRSVNPWKPYAALDYATRLMAGHLREFGRLDWALAAYNAGPTAVRDWGGVPEYEETEHYVRVILDDWEAPIMGDEPEDIQMNRWIKMQMQGLASAALGMAVRADAGVMPIKEELADLNQRFADIINNWPALWAKEKARRAQEDS